MHKLQTSQSHLDYTECVLDMQQLIKRTTAWIWVGFGPTSCSFTPNSIIALAQSIINQFLLSPETEKI